MEIRGQSGRTIRDELSAMVGIDDTGDEGDVEETSVETEPGTTEDEGEDEETGDESEEEESDVRSGPLSARERRILAQAEAALTQQTTAEDDEISFGNIPNITAAFVSDDTIDGSLNTVDGINALLQRVANQAMITTLGVIKETLGDLVQGRVRKSLKEHSDVTGTIQQFYTANGDLADSRELLQYVAKNISRDNPTHSLRQVLDTAAVETRKLLGIKATAKPPSPKKRSNGLINNSNIGARTQNQGKPSKKDKNSILSQLEMMERL